MTFDYIELLTIRQALAFTQEQSRQLDLSEISGKIQPMIDTLAESQTDEIVEINITPV